MPPLVAEGAAATLAAELFTLPLALHHFGRLSTVGLPANLLVEPLVPLVMLGGVLTALAGVPGGVVGDAVGLAPWLPARLLLAVVEGLGALPWATAGVPVPAWPLVAGGWPAHARPRGVDHRGHHYSLAGAPPGRGFPQAVARWLPGAETASSRSVPQTPNGR